MMVAMLVRLRLQAQAGLSVQKYMLELVIGMLVGVGAHDRWWGQELLEVQLLHLPWLMEWRGFSLRLRLMHK